MEAERVKLQMNDCITSVLCGIGLLRSPYGCTSHPYYQDVLWLCHSAWQLGSGPGQDEGALVKVKDKNEQTGYESVYIWFISQSLGLLFSNL